MFYTGSVNALRLTDLLTPAEYLARELESPVKHEYVGGVVHAMSGARVRHNRIVMSVLGRLSERLRGQACEPFGSDMKVRIQLPTHVRFYYPDAMVVCQSSAEGESFQDHPGLIVEVLSRGTRRADLGEKREGYLRIASLASYLLVEQEAAEVVVYRRTDHGFIREVYQGLEAVIDLPEISCSLSLAEIYERVEFGPDPEEADDEA